MNRTLFWPLVIFFLAWLALGMMAIHKDTVAGTRPRKVGENYCRDCHDEEFKRALAKLNNTLWEVDDLGKEVRTLEEGRAF
jgi:hypothetical protein